MREKLKQLNGTRTRFKGTFIKYGEKSSYKGKPKRTLLLQHIKDNSGTTLTSHVWLICGKQFDELGELTEGDIIDFHARVTPYAKGYVNNRDGYDNRRIDYRLSNPTRVKVIRKVIIGQNKIIDFGVE